MEKNLTEGSILKSLVSLAVPIIFVNILQTAYQLIDTFWVGRLGTVAVAAVSVSFPIIFFIISLGAGLPIAGAILISHYKGMENQKKIDKIASQTILVVLAVSTLISTAGYFLTPFLIKLIGVEKDVFISSVSYMRISFIGVVFMFIYMAFQSLMRGIGEVKIPMYIVLGTVFLNLILDPLFIFGYFIVPSFGVAGAAIATVITQGISALIGIFILSRGKFMRIDFRKTKPDIRLIKKMFALGIPSSIEQSARTLGMTVMTFLVASFGTVAIAAYGIGVRIISFVIIPAVGLSMATSTLIGQNIGAGKIKRAEKIAKLSSIIGFASLTIAGILFFVFAKKIAAIFIPGQAKTIEECSLFIRVVSLTFGFIGIQMSLNGAFRGSGNTLISMAISVISMWALRFPIAYLLSKLTSLSELGIWIAFPAANVISAIIAILWFYRGTWKNRHLTKETQLKKQIMQEAIIEE